MARPRDPLKAKQLHKGLQQLGEEGAIQVFEAIVGNTLLLGAVGQLQFEVVAARLASEYKVDAIYDDAEHRHRALAHLSRRQRPAATSSASRAASLAIDVDGNPVYPRAQHVQPAGDDGALAEGRLPRHARTRRAYRARLTPQRAAD